MDETYEHVNHMHIVHFHHLYISEIMILFHCYLYQLNLENNQKEYFPLIVSYLQPIVDFVFLYLFLSSFFCVVFI